MKNKFLNGLYDLVKRGCVIFTVTVFAFYILGELMSNTVKVLTLSTLFLIFLFSVWFALSNKLLRTKKMNIVLRVFLHFISTVVGFFVIFVYLPGNTANSSSAFVLTLGFAGLYLLIAALILTVIHLFNKRKESKEYKSIYESKEEPKEENKQ